MPTHLGPKSQTPSTDGKKIDAIAFQCMDLELCCGLERTP